MHAHQYEQEHQAQVIITRYRHEANQARQIRLARGEWPHRIVEASVRPRGTVGAILIAAGQYLRQEPVATPDQSPDRDLAVEPGDSALTV
jgi:hypothetical protein